MITLKYQECKLELWGKNHYVWCYDDYSDPTQINIFLKSRPHTCNCPSCGMPSNSTHSTYVRKLQEVPFWGRTTYIHANVYTYNCENPDCQTKTFTERLPFAHESQTRTDSLTLLILATSIFMSNEGCSFVLSKSGIIVSADTIKNMWNRIEFIDKYDVEEIGVDDVAKRKGQSYATAVYDKATNRMIALLDGRDGKTFQEWLEQHPKIKRVSRDRSSAYAAAITRVLPECIQVADRFHLLQNLIEHLRKIFNAEVPKQILIKDGQILDCEPEKVIIEEAIKDAHEVDTNVQHLNYDNTPPLDKSGNEIQFNSTITGHHNSQRKKRQEKREKKSRNLSK